MPGNDSYTKLLIQAKEADGSTTPADSSASVHTLTAVNQAQVDTAQYPPLTGATGSLLFDGNDGITTPDSADWDFGTGDFTIDLWARIATDKVCYLISLVNDDWSIVRFNSGTLRFRIGGTDAISAAWSPSTNTWYHIAVVRSGTSLVMYVDGTSIGSATNSTNLTTANQLAIGNYASSIGAEGFNGHLGEVRLSKGIARWTANFTRPSAQYGPDSIQSPRSMHQNRMRRT